MIHKNNIDDSFNHWNGVYYHHLPDRNREIIKSLIAKIKARVLIEPHPVVSIAEEEIRNAKLNKTQMAAMQLLREIGTSFSDGKNFCLIIFVLFLFYRISFTKKSKKKYAASSIIIGFRNPDASSTKMVRGRIYYC